MRIVERVTTCSRNRVSNAWAAAAFGDATVFIEPYIEPGRHIEVQIVGEGEVLHFGERDWPVQRRNRKVSRKPRRSACPTTFVQRCTTEHAPRSPCEPRGAGTVSSCRPRRTINLEVKPFREHPSPVTGVTSRTSIRCCIRAGLGMTRTQSRLITVGFDGRSVAGGCRRPV